MSVGAIPRQSLHCATDPQYRHLTMSLLDRNKWNQRYLSDSQHKNNPVDLLSDWIDRIPPGKALDVACGSGRNSIFLAEAGFDVDAIDISQAGLEIANETASGLGLEINWFEHDLDQPFPFSCQYNLIVVMWYVNLQLIEQLCDRLQPGGYLICVEHLQTDEPVIGPRTQDFRVAPGALAEAVASLETLYYCEAVTPTSENERVASASLVARKRSD